MTLSDRQGHSPIASLFKRSFYRAVVQMTTFELSTHRAVPLRQLSFLVVYIRLYYVVIVLSRPNCKGNSQHWKTRGQ